MTDGLALISADLTPLPTVARGTKTTRLVRLTRLSRLFKVTESMAAVARANVGITELSSVVRLTQTVGSASHQLTGPAVTVNSLTRGRDLRRTASWAACLDTLVVS